MIEFLKGFKAFEGIRHDLDSTISPEHFYALYKHYKDTGINLLDDYSSIDFYFYEMELFKEGKIEEPNHSAKQIDKVKPLMANEVLRKLFGEDRMHLLSEYLNLAQYNYEIYEKLENFRKTIKWVG